MNILIVCAGNSFRSPVAARLLERELSSTSVERFAVDTAGLRVIGDPDSCQRDIALSLSGLEPRDHTPRNLDSERLSWAHLVLCFEPAHVKQVLQLKGTETEVQLLSEVHDPFVTGDYAVALKQIDDAVRGYAPRLLGA